MKNVTISKALFVNLIRYFFASDIELENDIKNELRIKVDSLALREYYTEYVTATTQEKKEEAKHKYLDAKEKLYK